MTFYEQPLDRIRLKDGNEYPSSPAYRTPITGTGTHKVMDYPVNINVAAGSSSNNYISVTIYGQDTQTIPLFKISSVTEASNILTTTELSAISGVDISITGILKSGYDDQIVISGESTSVPIPIRYTNANIFNYGVTNLEKLVDLYFSRSGSPIQDLTITTFRNFNCSHCCINGLDFLILSSAACTESDEIYSGSSVIGTGTINLESSGIFLACLQINPFRSDVISGISGFRMTGTLNVCDYHFDNRFLRMLPHECLEFSPLAMGTGTISDLNIHFPNLEAKLKKNSGRLVDFIMYYPTEKRIISTSAIAATVDPDTFNGYPIWLIQSDAGLMYAAYDETNHTLSWGQFEG